MCSAATTKNKLKIQALNQISMLQNLVAEIEDEGNDIVDISFMVDRISQDDGVLKDIIEECSEY